MSWTHAPTKPRPTSNAATNAPTDTALQPMNMSDQIPLNRSQRRALAKAKPPKLQRRLMRTLPINMRFNAETERKLQMVPHAELEKVRLGISNEESMHTIIARLNLGYVLAGEFFEGGEQREVMEKSLVAVRSMKERFARTGKVGATGDEFFAIGDGLNMTDEMQKHCTRRELDKAMTFVFETAGQR